MFTMKQQSGFTLIELVIVIIILAILSVSALPKFLDLQSDARQGSMQGLKAALESASTFTFTKARMENLGDRALEELSSGIKIRYGYPRATQTELKKVLDFSEDDWKLSSPSNAVIFTIASETDDLTNTQIYDESICKLTYNQAEKDERPVIAISGCND